MNDLASSTPCPDESVLARYLLGRLDELHSDAVERHVGECASCQGSAASVHVESDVVLQQLKVRPDAPRYQDESACRLVVESLEELGADGARTPSPESPSPKSNSSEFTRDFPPPITASLTTEQFVQQLLENQIVAERDINRVLATLDPDNTSADTDPACLAAALVSADLLTEYQLGKVLADEASQLSFGEYTVLDRVGAGGMGEVWKARQNSLDRIVAIKMLPPHMLDSTEAVKRFYREVRAAARLSHHNVVRAFDAGEHDGMHYLVMEYIAGKDLSQIARRGQLPPAHALECVVQAARGLAYAHAEGLVHRDVKPANLLVDRSGVVKILDMGLARIGKGDEDDGLTKSGQIMGTVDYMAPEQATDTHRADARSDIYSLGCTLHRLLTGKRVFEGRSTVNRLLAHANDPIPSLCEQRSGLPTALDAVFAKMVAKQPEQRHASMDELLRELEPIARNFGAPNLASLLDDDPSRGTSNAESDTIGLAETVAFDTDTVRNQSRRRKPRRWYAVAGVAALVGALMVAGAPRWWQPTVPPQANPNGGSEVANPSRAATPSLPTAATASQSNFNVLLEYDGKLIPIPANDELTIGRKSDNDFELDEKNQIASRYHARVFRRADELILEDLGSKNGTYWNGRKVQQQAIAAGDIIRFGESVVRVVRFPAEPAANRQTRWNGLTPIDELTRLDTSEEFDLLDLVDLSKDQVRGEWTSDNGVLRSDEAAYSRIQIPVIPRGAYRLEARFKRLSGVEAIAFTLPVGDAQCRVVLNGWGGLHSGLDMVQRRNPPHENPTHSLFECKTGVEYELDVEVANNGVSCYVVAKIDGRDLFRWSGRQQELSMSSPEIMPDRRAFALGSFESSYEFSKVELKMLDGFAVGLRQPTDADAPASEDTPAAPEEVQP